jgi:hypothetical protein
MARFASCLFFLPAAPDRGLLADRLCAVIALVALATWASTGLFADDGSVPATPAQQVETAPAPASSSREQAQREFVLAGYGGAPYTHPSDVHFSDGGATDLTARGVVWEGKPFKSPVYYGIRTLGWSSRGTFGAMLDFTHSKTISQPYQEVNFSGMRNGQKAPERARIGDTFRHFEFSHGHNTLTFNGMVRLASILPRLAPYIGVGAGVALPHTEVQFLDDPSRTYEYQYVGPAAQGLIGLELRAARLSLFLEYKFTIAHYTAPLTRRDGGWWPGDFWTQFQSWMRAEKPKGGLLTTILGSHQVAAGLGLRMGPRATVP